MRQNWYVHYDNDLCSRLLTNKMQPISENELSKFINTTIESNNDIHVGELSKDILQLLKNKSSKFKYIITSTVFNIIDYSENNKINSSFNALWDESSDGLINVKFTLNDKQLLLTIIFVSI